MPRPLRVLFAEDNPADAELILRELRQAGFAPEWHRVQTEAEFVARLRPDVDIILSDYEMPQFSGIRALALLHEHRLDIPFIIISGTIGEDTAVEAIKQGASDYLLKDRLARLGSAVEMALEKSRLSRQRQHAEAALHESEERFRQLAENIQDAFWLTNVTKSQMLYVSPAYEEIWGRPCAELFASPGAWLAAIHPDDRERVLDAAVTKQTAGKYDEEYRIVRPDGSVRWIRDRAFPVANAAGETDRMAGVARDITKRKRAEAELRQSEARFAKTFHSNPAAMCITTLREGRFCEVNDRYCQLFGFTRDELIGQTSLGLALWDDPAERALAVERLGACGSFRDQETLFRRKDRAVVQARISMELTDLPGESEPVIISMFADVTERRRAEERLREQASMLDHAHEAIIVRDIHTRRITFWNKGAERLYGWTAAEAEGSDIVELIFAERRMPAGLVEELLSTGECHREGRQVTKAGKEVTVSSHVTLVRDASGNPKSALVINIDITEQKNLEARYLRAQRMESIGTLASGIAHDLNNILAPIMMSVPVLRMDLPADQREGVISTIEMSAERGAQIVRQVLTFGRGIEGERHPLQVAYLFKEMGKIIRGTFPKNITLENGVDADLWQVIGDATQLHQVLLNLCVNARDAMPGGGKLRLSARNLAMDESYASMMPELKPGPHVLIGVSDSGSGIPPEIAGRIFDPFFTTKGIGKGTGLGLSTVLGIVRSHGGHIEVTSEPGLGTTFHIYLPASPGTGDAAGAVAPAPMPPQGNGEAVLVVDDEEAVRGAVRNVLEAHGYQVLQAADGTEALATFAENSAKIAVVLTDIMMPFMEGVPLIKALRRMQTGLPIIASTGLMEKVRTSELAELNVTSILNKPYSANALLQAVHEALHPPAAEPPSG